MAEIVTTSAGLPLTSGDSVTCGLPATKPDAVTPLPPVATTLLNPPAPDAISVTVELGGVFV